MTPQDWNEALKPSVPTSEANKFIATIVRAHLAHLAANVLLDDLVSTTTLVEGLYPLAYAKHSEVGIAARNRIFNALIRVLHKTTLADCVTRGPKQRLGKSKFKGRPFLWHAPKEVPRCHCCGQELRATS